MNKLEHEDMRDYFAGLAMQSLIALSQVRPLEDKVIEAYRIADLMMWARLHTLPGPKKD